MASRRFFQFDIPAKDHIGAVRKSAHGVGIVARHVAPHLREDLQSTLKSHRPGNVALLILSRSLRRHE